MVVDNFFVVGLGEILSGEEGEEVQAVYGS